MSEITRYWTTCEDGIHGLDPAPKGKGDWVKYIDHLRAMHAQSMGRWKAVCDTDVFQELKHGKYRDILELLSDGEISIGKAAQSIAERANGIEPSLPPHTLDDESCISWKDRYDKLKAEYDENLKITG